MYNKVLTYLLTYLVGTWKTRTPVKSQPLKFLFKTLHTWLFLEFTRAANFGFSWYSEGFFTNV